MIIARVSSLNGQGAVCYIQLEASLENATTTVECYIPPSSSAATQQAIMADACRQALGADEAEPVRLLGGITEVS
jgi:DNA repair protein RadC